MSDSRPFELVTNYKPAGDQPQAIEKLVNGVKQGYRDQLLLGVTGSGKTYTMANVISQLQLRRIRTVFSFEEKNHN